MIQLAANRCSQWYVVMGSQVVVNGYHKLEPALKTAILFCSAIQSELCLYKLVWYTE